MKIYRVTYFTRYYGESKTYVDKLFTDKGEAGDYAEYLELVNNDFEDNVGMEEVETTGLSEQIDEVKHTLGENEDRLYSQSHESEMLDFCKSLITKYEPRNFSI